MFENRLKKNLKEDERVIRLIRKYFFVFTGPLLFSVIFIIASFFFLYPLFHWGAAGIAIFILLIGIGVLLALRVFVEYSFNVFIITDQRIIDIDQHGFFERTVSEMTYDKIQDVSFKIKGLAQTLLHYGSIIIQTAGAQANIELQGVKNPEKVQQIIIEIQKELCRGEKLSNSQLNEIMRQIKNHLPSSGNEESNKE